MLKMWHKASQPTVNDLPYENLLHIFSLLLESYHEPSVIGIFFHWRKSHRPIRWKPVQLLLSRVCRRWRDVVLTSPALWSTIRVRAVDDEKILPLLELFFTRSLPLKLDFELHANARPTLAKTGLWKLLRKYMVRFRSLKLRASHQSLFEQVLTLAASEVSPNLVNLSITSDIRPRYSSYEYPRFFFTGWDERWQSMRVLELSGACNSLTFLSYPSFPSLTELRLSYLCPFSKLLKTIFTNIPSLQTLVIGGAEHWSGEVDDEWHDDDPFQDIEAPSLKTFAIHFEVPHTNACLCSLPLVVTKSLENLEINSRYYYIDSEPSPIHHHHPSGYPFIRSPALRNLRLYTSDTRENGYDYWIDVLSALSRAVDVDIIHHYLPNYSFVQEVLYHPHVKSLAFYVHAKVTQKLLDDIASITSHSTNPIASPITIHVLNWDPCDPVGLQGRFSLDGAIGAAACRGFTLKLVPARLRLSGNKLDTNPFLMETESDYDNLSRDESNDSDNDEVLEDD